MVHAFSLRIFFTISKPHVNLIEWTERCWVKLRWFSSLWFVYLSLFLIHVVRYSADYGMFKFCVADSEHDWRAGSEQYEWIEKCLASADRRKQPWLIFAAHRVLGYASHPDYTDEGSFGEPMGRDDLQKLWQRYKVDIPFFGHFHNYERICPIYQVYCILVFFHQVTREILILNQT